MTDFATNFATDFATDFAINSVKISAKKSATNFLTDFFENFFDEFRSPLGSRTFCPHNSYQNSSQILHFFHQISKSSPNSQPNSRKILKQILTKFSSKFSPNSQRILNQILHQILRQIWWMSALSSLKLPAAQEITKHNMSHAAARRRTSADVDLRHFGGLLAETVRSQLG